MFSGEIKTREIEHLHERLDQIETKIDKLNDSFHSSFKNLTQELASVLQTNLNEPKNGYKNEPPKEEEKSPDNYKRPVCLSPQTKSPIELLNQKYLGLNFKELTKSGPDHFPTFNVSVEIDGITFYGTGHSKKDAKNDVALAALRALDQSPKTTETEDKNLACAVKILNEKIPHLEYKITENFGSINSRFQAIVRIKNEEFVGFGSKKQIAKNSAALKALAKIMPNVKPVDLLDTNREKGDFIAKLVEAKFEALMAKDFLYNKRKFLAGVVMVKNGEWAQAEVVTMATGTKCISGQNISLDGTSLNDLHAEVLARRCLLNFFYNQLKLLTKNSKMYEKSIFCKRDDKKGYKLKDGVEFGFYISTAPCGDARVFGSEIYDSNRIARGRGVLRTKIESGEGSIPINDRTTQTWDGIIQGDRLLTMSCSDKMAKWNVLGLQGALLTHFIEPIYLKFVVFGSQYHETHVTRALYGRIEKTLPQIDPPFYLNRPEFHLVTLPQTRVPTSGTSFSILWSLENPEVEIVDTETGKPSFGVSKFCKFEFLRGFQGLVGKILSVTGVENCRLKVYADVKEAATDYQVVKKTLYAAFKDAGLGKWVSRPVEQDRFEVEG